jgi:WD40 repeat protein
VIRWHINVVRQARFSPDGRWLVTAGPATAGLGLVATGRATLLLRGHVKPLTSASFSPDGRFVLTSSRDGTVRLYRCEICAGVDGLVALATRRLEALAR